LVLGTLALIPPDVLVDALSSDPKMCLPSCEQVLLSASASSSLASTLPMLPLLPCRNIDDDDDDG